MLTMCGLWVPAPDSASVREVPGCGTAFPEWDKAPTENPFRLVRHREMRPPLAKGLDASLSEALVRRNSLLRMGTLLAKNTDQA
jgi:hypothetical protein